MTINDEGGFFAKTSPAQDGANIPIQCADYIAVIATLQVTSNDGRINERISNVAFTTTDGVHYNAVTPGLPSTSLRGNYVDVHESHCLLDLNFSVHIGPNRFTGEVLEQVTRLPCDRDASDRAVSEVRAANW